MSTDQADMQKAASLNMAIMQMAEQTAEHQRESKVVELVQSRALESLTLAAATASLQWNSQVNFRMTETLRDTMKILLNAQMQREAIEVQELVAALMRDQIVTQKSLAEASEKDATASRFLGIVNVFLAFSAVALAVVQVVIALHLAGPLPTK